MAAAASPNALLPQLAELDKVVQAQLAEENSFRKNNANLPRNETTTLLLQVCEKLALQKDAMERANFEEHTSELAYLCKRFGTSIDSGLSERALREHQAAANPSSGSREKPKSKRPFFFCCSREFPPQQTWWLDIQHRLCPSFQVLRTGGMASATGCDLQAGDIIYLLAGQRCPADARVLVYEQGTAADVHCLTLDGVDVRAVTTEPTAAPITDSGNMVLKDGYLVSGALFGMVVRVPTGSVMPDSAREGDRDSPFALDTSLPPGMTVSQCRGLFKQLCQKGRLACRSFRIAVKLARSRPLVVLITQDDVTKGTVPSLAAAAKRLGRALVLVASATACELAALTALAKEMHVDLMDFKAEGGASGATTASTDLPVAEGSSARGGNSPLSFSESGCRMRHCTGAERAKVWDLSREISSKTVDCAILRGPSQEAIVDFCSFLTESGASPLFAMGAFQYPECFRRLVIKGQDRRSSMSSTMTFSEMATSEDSGRHNHFPPRRTPAGPMVSRMGSRVSSTSQSSRRSSPSATSMPHASTDPRRNSPSASTMPPHASTDPVSNLADLHQETQFTDLVVSLNSVGIVSEYADCVLLTSDLGSLGQALELATKGVPATATSDEEDAHPALPEAAA